MSLEDTEAFHPVGKGTIKDLHVAQTSNGCACGADKAQKGAHRMR